MDKLILNIPEKVFRYLTVCLGIIIFIIIAGIIPLSCYNAAINQEIKKMQSQLEEQKNLQSAYAMLMKNRGKEDSGVLPNPSRIALPRREANKFQDVFKETTQKAGLKMVSISPELTPAGEASNFLLHTAIVRGEFVDFRKMLIGLGNLPYLEKIEEISIQQYPDELEFKLKILIALGN